ncbi:MAG: transglutaminase N-terminal domain-containing protein [Planctomycetaceae bacterium]
MKYAVRHITGYSYDDPVSLCENQAHLTPRAFARQKCEMTTVTVQPEPAAIRSWTDYFGNAATYFSVEVPHDELTVTAESIVDVTPPALVSAIETPAWEEARDAIATLLDESLFRAAQFTFESPLIRMIPEATDYARVSFPAGRPLLEAAMDLTKRIYKDFKYDPAATCVNTPTEELFRKGRGVCQDFAHLQITCLRSLGLAARYVSGYLLTDPPPGQPKLVGSDASHAWVSVYCPGHDWVDFDPTNKQMPEDRHITLAWGRDYSDVCPIKGVFLGGGEHRMYISVDVTPAVG